ncbi:MAG: SmvA family efflux MFS transporter [Acinetobacter populi]|jgi:DHA2 family multidrug resistance protein-like MFS transporter|uniref:SmvA family efflux MFS transporter n=1 Tax=Acinetobacter populi TaxID=1582270 RepID=UPI002357E3CC|nr:SmvA family efflux MFS transporter [Acinetobacter populi]MCH4246798.1 SmvA family efflux MFS transporter [Acinetobacter populi]
MFRKWLILAIVILIYLPVAMDATILHVAAPTLSEALALSNKELLWIIDIYSLVMAGLILPMGALGDRIGFKRLMIIGSTLFGIASVFAAFSDSAMSLIGSRALLAVGAAMIIPATLSAIRNTFLEEKQRNFALGIWATVGGGGAAFGPLLGGAILGHFHWGAVFLINIPVIILVLLMTIFFVPKQKVQTTQNLNLLQALILVIAILSIIYALKTGITVFNWMSITIFVVGFALLVGFIQNQFRSASPMIDFHLFKNRFISTGIIMAIVAMMALVGFELLISQELQFVYGYTALEAGLFVLPFMLAISCGGPIASILVNKFGLRRIATTGILLSGLSMFGLAYTDFASAQLQAWGMMILLGMSVQIALLSSTAAIMSSVSPEKAAAAGAIEGMAYELGAGFGVAFFGLMLSWFYMQSIVMPSDLPQALIPAVSSSIGEAMYVANDMDTSLATQIQDNAKAAFTLSHRQVLNTSGILLMILAAYVWLRLPNPHRKDRVVESLG